MVCYQSLLIVEDDPRQSCILFAYFQSMRVGDISIATSIDDATKILASKNGSVDSIICGAQHSDFTQTLDKNQFQGTFILLSENDDELSAKLNDLHDQKAFKFNGTLKKPLTKRILDEKFTDIKSEHKKSIENLGVEITPSELNAAILNDEIVTLYQPRIDFKTGRIKGAKAHIRWHSPSRGFVSPLDFLPTAEKTGLIFDITFSMLSNIADDIKNGGEDWGNMTIAISLPTQMLNNPQLAKVLKGQMELIGIDCSSICLEIDGEITENLLPSTTALLQKLKDAGFELALKKACTASLNAAANELLPFTELSIDRSVVNNVLTDAISQETIRTGIALAHKMGWRVAAEGIETQEIYDLVKAFGADFAQGYFISKPLPAEYITQTISKIAA